MNNYLETYKNFNAEAIKAKRSGNYKEAKILYISAGETLLEFAMTQKGDTHRQFRNEAKNIIAYAESLPNTDTAEIHPPQPLSEKKPEPVSVQPDNTDFKPIEPDDIDVYFSDVKGLGKVEEAIRHAVVYPMTQPEAFERLNDKPGAGILMYGLPGTGKTMIAKATAKECNAKFYEIKASDIVDKFVGESEKGLRQLFDEARRNERAIIFFDEFDGIAMKRGIGESWDNRLTNELLAQMEGFNKSPKGHRLFIMAASNFPGNIDEACIQRLGNQIRIPEPNVDSRRAIIEHAYKGIVISEDIDIGDLANKLKGYSGREIANFCHTSKKPAHDRYAKSQNPDDLEIRLEDISYAHENYKCSPNKSSSQALDTYERSLTKN